MFAKPDYYLQASALTGGCAGRLACQSTGFAYDHGDYAAEINTNYAGFAGPGVRRLGLDGPAACEGPNSAGPDSGQVTVAQQHLPGPWVDETDIRPTLMYLAGLRDDYQHDGRVITQILAAPDRALSDPAVPRRGLLQAAELQRRPVRRGHPGGVHQGGRVHQPGRRHLSARQPGADRAGPARDALAGRIKAELQAAASGDAPVRGAAAQTAACHALIGAARHLAAAG